MDDLPLDLRKPVFEKLYTIAEYTKMTKEEQEIYDAQRKRKWDNEAVKEQQRIDLEERAKQIRTEALLKGLEQGLIEGQRAMALKMKQDGISMDMIMKYTGLSAEEIKVL